MKTCAAFLTLLLTLFGAPVSAEEAIVTGPDRRHEIDLRIAELDAEHDAISTKGPHAATVVGVLVMVAGGALIGVAFLNCNDYEAPCEDWGTNYHPPKAWAGFALLGIGVTTATVGGLVWNGRIKQRDKIDAERKSLIEERDGLAATLSRLELRSPYRDGTQFATLGLRF